MKNLVIQWYVNIKRMAAKASRCKNKKQKINAVYIVILTKRNAVSYSARRVSLVSIMNPYL